MKRILCFAWALLLMYSIYSAVDYKKESLQSHRAYTEIRAQLHDAMDQTPKPDLELEPDSGIISVLYEPLSSENLQDKTEVCIEKAVLDRYSELIKRNGELVGWLYIPGTRIDYPVVRGKDNVFYLSHGFDKAPAKAGAVFMDYRNNGGAEQLHTILYGHNMRDGSMFRDLMKYRNEAFLLDHKRIEFHTLYEEFEWEIFSVYVTSIDFYYIETNFSSPGEYEDFIHSILVRSMFNTGIVPTAEDAILTLSTCTNVFENARFVVHARRTAE